MKGILLAGGSASRLKPTSKSINKHLIPIYNKPMIYYSLSVLMLAKIRDILIITNKESLNLFKKLLGDGSKFGIKIEYKVQNKPNGIGEAFKIGKKFISNSKVCLILGDNLFYGQFFASSLSRAKKKSNGCNIFVYRVKNPSHFGVITFNKNGKVVEINEKPSNPDSNYIVTGLYFFDNTVIKKAEKISKSKRGEYEISDILNQYINNNKLFCNILGRGFVWHDAGSFENLSYASEFVRTTELQQGFLLSSIEEIAFRNKWINKKKLLEISNEYNNKYGNYLKKICYE